MLTASRLADPGKIKVVLVGDSGVGKTRLCASYKRKEAPRDHHLPNFDGYAPSITIGIETWLFGLWDTAGEADHERLRPMSYPQTDIFVVCFSVASRVSFENVQQKWFPEVRHHCPNVPLFDEKVVQKLAGQGKLPVSPAEGEMMTRRLGAARYFECSANKGQGVDDGFDQVLAIAIADINLKRRAEKATRKCIVL
ncbi:cell division control protein 42 [Mycena olivaceomarginata]|nr:cell division control protein 42 [Mycena olivaceomarginata]